MKMELLISVKGFELDALKYMADKKDWDPSDVVRLLVSDEFDRWFRDGRVEESFFTECALDPAEAQVLE